MSENYGHCASVFPLPFWYNVLGVSDAGNISAQLAILKCQTIQPAVYWIIRGASRGNRLHVYACHCRPLSRAMA